MTEQPDYDEAGEIDPIVPLAQGTVSRLKRAIWIVLGVTSKKTLAVAGLSGRKDDLDRFEARLSYCEHIGIFDLREDVHEVYYWLMDCGVGEREAIEYVWELRFKFIRTYLAKRCCRNAIMDLFGFETAEVDARGVPLEPKRVIVVPGYIREETREIGE